VLFILVSAAHYRNSDTMTVQVRFFASLRERFGTDDTQITLRTGATAADVWRQILDEAEMPANTLVAINQDYTTFDTVVHDGDEVAFFPPVTGG
jgi:molybdopterin synthase sulfur carrier subunit